MIEQLTHTLQIWMRRLRWQRAVMWAVRGLVIGLGLAIVVGGLALVQAKILRNEFLFLVAISSTLLPLLCGLIAYFWRIQPLTAARYFDHEFGLGERVSTALELRDADHGNKLIQKQLEDAVKFSRKVKPAPAMPFRFKRIDGILALLCVGVIAALWFRGESLFVAASHQRQVESAIAQQESKIEEIIKAIDENKSLSDAQKQALTEPLQQAQKELQEAKSLEGAVSVMTSTGEKMQALSQQGAQTMQSLKAAGGSLAAQEGSPLETLGKDLASGNFAKAAVDLSNMDLSQMNSQELQQTADQLDALANQLQSTNPQMAQQLRDAAQKIRAGDLAAAQQSLNNAAQQMAQVAQQAAASQAAGQAAGQVQSGTQQLLAAGGGQTAQANQGQGAGNQGQGNQGQGQQGNNQNGQSNQGSAGGGSGSSNGSDSNQAGQEAGSSPIEQNNGAGNGGESAYEPIYAPSLLGGAGGDTLGLPTAGDQGQIVGQSPTSATQNQSLVPYSQVYSQYQSINQQAIDNGEVPAQFMDIIWSYFSSIQP